MKRGRKCSEQTLSLQVEKLRGFQLENEKTETAAFQQKTTVESVEGDALPKVRIDPH
jgi:hypothetical protein